MINNETGPPRADRFFFWAVTLVKFICLLYFFYDLFEYVGVMFSQVREYFSIKQNAGF